MNTHYLCKRCFHKCKQKNDMVKHLNNKKLCEKSIESYKYSNKDEELYNLSLIKESIIQNNNLMCKNCNKCYTTRSNLNQHINNYCKKLNNNIIKNIENDNNKNDDKMNNKNENDNKTNNKNINDNFINNIGNNNINNITDNSINNITDNSINNITDNSINNITNISLNINIIKSFDDEWCLDHIEDNDKLILLLNNSKFTSTLENILENEVNLNVLIENSTNDGLVFNNNKLNKMTIKDIVKKTMKKLLNHLDNFKNDIILPNQFNINTDIIHNEIKIAENKYNDYTKNKDIQNNVNKCITNIFQKKVDDTYKKYKNIADNMEGF